MNTMVRYYDKSPGLTIPIMDSSWTILLKESGATFEMKATGIVRRIDDLGRVVIPKEIRRTLRIREGDPLEIFVDRDGEVILKNIHRLVNWAISPRNMQSRCMKEQGILP